MWGEPLRSGFPATSLNIKGLKASNWLIKTWAGSFYEADVNQERSKVHSLCLFTPERTACLETNPGGTGPLPAGRLMRPLRTHFPRCTGVGGGRQGLSLLPVLIVCPQSHGRTEPTLSGIADARPHGQDARMRPHVASKVEISLNLIH